MTVQAFWEGFLPSVASGLLIFLGGVYSSTIRKIVTQRKLRRFWSNAVSDEGIVLCYGQLEDPRVVGADSQDVPPLRWHKTFVDGRQPHRLNGPVGPLASEREVAAASYIMGLLSRHRETPLRFVSDVEACQDLGKTIVSFGSISSNQVTDIAMRQDNNSFLMFAQDGQGSYISVKPTDEKLRPFQPPLPSDYGIVMRLRNKHSASRFFFVCAGVGEWGTSGAAWYLANNWERLNREFRADFGVLVEVKKGMDTSAVRIYPTQ